MTALTPPSVAPGGADVAPADEPTLEWTFNPWGEDARRAGLAALAALLVATLVVASRLAPLTTLALAATVAVMLGPGFAVSHCRVDAGGVARRLAFLWWDRRAWTSIRSARLSRGGLVVSPHRGTGVLATLRELVLPIPSRAAVDELRADLARRLTIHGF